MGFQLKEAALKPSRRNAATGCVQEFEFKPRSGSEFQHLDEAELAFLPSSNGGLDLLIQRDTKARGLGSMLSEMAGTDESHYLLTLRGNETADELQKALSDVLR
ncbi:sporulation protein [Modicisalibacter xianhensis]|nr:sporulation protein [Halomonas xianhensis]